MENRRHSRLSATRVAAAVAQEAICTLMSSDDKEFEQQLQYGNSFKGKKRDSGSVIEPGQVTDKPSSNKIPKRESMFESYQVWAMQTYGDSAKTKTVTRKKYNRIMKILKGEESTNVENSKFRFWVKAKGFRIGSLNFNGNGNVQLDGNNNDSRSKLTSEQVLYVPCTKSTGSDRDETIYKRVAVVENFYDIIYNVHVEMDGRSGKHAGQKRTYKAVAEMYAFLPREAVTRFLMSCSDCQKRMHISTSNSCNGITGRTNSKSHSMRNQHETSDGCTNPNANGNGANTNTKTTLDIDYSLPLTTTIKRMKNAGYIYNLMGDSLIAPNSSIDGQVDEEIISETGASDADNNGDQISNGLSEDALCEEITADPNEDDEVEDDEEIVNDLNGSSYGINDEDVVPLDMSRVKCENNVCFEQPINMSSKRTTSSSSNNNNIKNNKMSSSSAQYNYGSFIANGASKPVDDDEDDEDDDGEHGERLSEQNGAYDPERLKAFNMFVRLFVDENLDRLVPISRQPKEKIQAIIESCTRQFPEFAERARKRIRTYLKSCRRTKRHKSGSGTGTGGTENGRWNESSKSSQHNHVSSYHLTSPMAEQILATACENECQNAKRMRMGLKPLAVSLSDVMSSNHHSNNNNNSSNIHHNINSHHSTAGQTNLTQTSTSASAVQVFQQNNSNSNQNILTSTFSHQHSIENGGAAVNQTSHGTPTNTNQQQQQLSTSKSANSNNNSNHYSLNPSEVAAVKQLIAGYRESAAFLLRSADELEQLILQQN